MSNETDKKLWKKIRDEKRDAQEKAKREGDWRKQIEALEAKGTR